MSSGRADDADLRQDLRFPYRLPVALIRGGEEIPLRTEDVSFQGLFLATDAPPPLRHLVRLKLMLPPFHRALYAHGMVVYAVPPDDPEGRPPGVGVQLYALDRAARGAWGDFVARIQAGEVPAEDEICFLPPEIL